MKCKKCQKMAVLNAFDDGSCLKCGEEINTPHMPCDKVCESCSDKLKVCQSCGESMDLKKKFGIAELKTEYAYSQKIKAQLNNGVEDRLAFPLLWRIIDYAEHLHKTKLTPELVEKLFEGFERREERYEQSNGLTIDLTNKQLDLGLQFYYFDGELDSIALRVKDFIVLSNEHPLETLADLARLTAAKPILLVIG